MPRRSSKSRAKSAPKSKAGGVRAGAGRKPAQLPDEVLAKLGELPIDPKGRRDWCANLLVIVLDLQLRGKIAPELAANIRASVGAIDRVLPSAPKGSTGNGATAGDDQDDEDEDDEEDGPQVDDAPDDGSLRVG